MDKGLNLISSCDVSEGNKHELASEKISVLPLLVSAVIKGHNP